MRFFRVWIERENFIDPKREDDERSTKIRNR